MNAFVTIDFGELVPGVAGLNAAGSGQTTATDLTRKVNVFTTITTASVSGAVLPSSYATGSEVMVMNRTGSTMIVWPASGDKIETFGVNASMTVSNGWNISFVSFDPPLARSPRTWYVISRQSVDSGGGLTNDGGFLLTDDADYPVTDAALPPGSVWNNGGVVTVVSGVTPNPSAPAVYFGLISSTDLLALGGGDLPLTSPADGSLQLWNNGGVVCVA